MKQTVGTNTHVVSKHLLSNYYVRGTADKKRIQTELLPFMLMIWLRSRRHKKGKDQQEAGHGWQPGEAADVTVGVWRAEPARAPPLCQARGGARGGLLSIYTCSGRTFWKEGGDQNVSLVICPFPAPPPRPQLL